jgi:hypothetical protein
MESKKRHHRVLRTVSTTVLECGVSRRRYKIMGFRHRVTALPLALAAVVVLAALGASPAHAVDMTYPGAQCSVTPGYANTAYSPAPGSIGNISSTQWLYVTCPVISQPFAAPISSGVVALINTNPAGVSCTLWSANIPSYTISSGWWNTQSTTTVSFNQQWLSFGSLPGNDHSFYACRIPPAYSYLGHTSAINAYRVIQ